MAKLQIPITDELMKNAKMYALNHQMTLKELVTTALERYISNTNTTDNTSNTSITDSTSNTPNINTTTTTPITDNTSNSRIIHKAKGPLVDWDSIEIDNDCYTPPLPKPEDFIANATFIKNEE